MANRVFIIYATGDEISAKELYAVLSRLQNIDVYIPEWMDVKGKNLMERIIEGLDSADLVIVLITFNSTNTMWLNQEIGYAHARNTPIISVVEKGIDVKGFLEGRHHIIFQRGDFKINVHQVISKIRGIFSQTKNPVTHFRVMCPTCEKDYFELLPTQKDIDSKIELSQKFSYLCSYCSSTLYVDPVTFDIQNNHT